MIDCCSIVFPEMGKYMKLLFPKIFCDLLVFFNFFRDSYANYKVNRVDIMLIKIYKILISNKKIKSLQLKAACYIQLYN